MIVDERSAAFFAVGAAQASGSPVAILCTSGTAAANYHPAICEADRSAVPLIVLTADRPPELRGVGAGQAIDQLKLYGESVRWFCEVGTHEADDDGLLHYRTTACRAFASARGEPRPGPVHLNLRLARAAGADSRRGSGDRDRPARPRGPRRAAADRGDADRHGAERLPARGGRQAHRRTPRSARSSPAASSIPSCASRWHTSRPPPAIRSSPSRPRRSAAARTIAPMSSPPTTCCCATSGSAKPPRPTWCCVSARCRPASRCASGWPNREPTR